MPLEPAACGLFRPEEIVDSSATAAQIPRCLRRNLGQFSGIQGDADGFMRPRAGVVQDGTLTRIIAGLGKAPSPGGGGTNRRCHLFAYPIGNFRQVFATEVLQYALA